MMLDKGIESCKKKGNTVKYNRNVYQALMMITQFGINMLVPIFLCTFVGIYLDRKLGTSFLAVTLFFIGALAGFTNVFRFARKIYERPSVRDRHHTKPDRGEEKDCTRK